MLRQGQNLKIFCDLDETLLTENSMYLQINQLGWSRKDVIIQLMQVKFSKARFKEQLSNLCPELTTPPEVNHEVMALINIFKSQDYKVFLTTAANQEFARGLTKKIFSFDGVIGSTHEFNNKGRKKLIGIRNLCKECEFIYIGDSLWDFPIWIYARESYCVNPTRLVCTISKLFRVKLTPI